MTAVQQQLVDMVPEIPNRVPNMSDDRVQKIINLLIIDDTPEPKKPTAEAWENFKTLRGCMKDPDDYDFEADKEAYLRENYENLN